MNNTLLIRLRLCATGLYQRWWSSPARRWLLLGVRIWMAELRGMLPAPLRARLNSGPQIQRLNWPLSTDLDESRTAERTAERVAERPADRKAERPAVRHAVLLLPAHEVMVQRVSLPLAATRDLPRVLAYEIDKFTPLPPEQVHFAARVERRHAHRAEVLLVALSHARLAAILDACEGAGLTLVGLQALDGQGKPLAVDLLPAQHRASAAKPARLNAWLLTIALCLLGAVLFATLDHRQAQVQAMASEVAGQRQQVAQLQTLRRELTDTRDAAGYLNRLQRARPTLSALLSELTTCLGDDTWLEQLELRDSRELSISGQSQRASALITQAKTCPSLEAAQFQGVIQPDGQTGRDRFSLTARLKQEALDAPTPDPQ